MFFPLPSAARQGRQHPYDNSTVTAVEDAAGKRSILFMNGKPTVQTSSGANYPKIGFEGGKELNTNEYAVGTHDFTDDAQPELVVSVRSATGDGLAIAEPHGNASARWSLWDMVSNQAACSARQQHSRTRPQEFSTPGHITTVTSISCPATT